MATKNVNPRLAKLLMDISGTLTDFELTAQVAISLSVDAFDHSLLC